MDINRTRIIMAALHSRYILRLWFLSSSFFPRLFLADRYWIPTILAHMMWP